MRSNRFRRASAALAAVAAGTLSAATVVGDPEVKTDHTYFQGELAYSTLDRLVASARATPGRPDAGDATRNDVLKLWYWRIEHYYHLWSPQEWNIPGQQPSPDNDDGQMVVFDCLSQQFSYGWGVCGTNHAMMRPIMEAAGYQSRRRGLHGDTTHEVLVAGRWAMVNTDSASIISLSDSATSAWAGVDDIVADRELLKANPLGIPQYPFGPMTTDATGTHSSDWHGYYDVGGAMDFSGGGSPYVMYAEGYQARPIAYVLRRGETFTRFPDRDGLPDYLGQHGAYRWWGYQGAGGPYRDWSFVGTAQVPAQQPPPSSRAIANSRFGNGIFEWTPTISAGDLDDGVVAKDAAIAYGATSPRLHATSGSAKITIAVFSPYVIAAEPSDGVDPAVSGATGGAWITPQAVGSVPVEVSVNGGASWTSLGSLSGGSALDFTDAVKGRHAYLLRFTVSTGAGLDALALRTCVNVCTAVFPMLKDDGSTVTYASGGRGVVEQNPDLGSVAADDAFRVGASANAVFNPLSATNNRAWTANDNQPIWVTYRISAPPGADLTRVDCAANAFFAVPSSAGTYARFAVSTDGGATFSAPFGSFSAPTDDELALGWGYGSIDVSGAHANSAIVRFETYNNGYTAGFRFLRLYGEYATPSPAALTVTQRWDDANGSGRSATQTIAAGTTSATWSVPTGASVVSRSISFAVAASAAGGGTTGTSTTGGLSTGGSTTGGSTTGGTTTGGSTSGGTTTGGTSSGGATTTGSTTGGASSGGGASNGGVGHHGCGHGAAFAVAAGLALAAAARRGRHP